MTPDNDLKEMDEKTILLINEDKDNEYRSCCFKCDKEFMKFMIQVCISYLILGLSIYKLLVITDNSEDRSIWISMITLILGIYTTVPKLKRNNIVDDK